MKPYTGSHPVAFRLIDSTYVEFPDAERVGCFAITPHLDFNSGLSVLSHQPTGGCVGSHENRVVLRALAEEYMKLPIPWDTFKVFGDFEAWKKQRGNAKALKRAKAIREKVAC